MIAESDLSCPESQEDVAPLSEDVSSSPGGEVVETDEWKVSSPVKRKKKVQVISPHHYDGDRESQNNNNSYLHPLKKNDKTRRKKRGFQRQYLKQVAQINDSSSNNDECDQIYSNLALHLPVDQYEVTLVRRAVYKSTDPLPPNMPSGKSIPPSDIGDTSLGMKLTILSGKVIVQSVVPLNDGRASPAQLTGMIHEGDILLSIDGRLLVGLGMHLDLLLERLKPLSESINDFFPKEIRIRFAVGHGLKLLHDAYKGSTSLVSRDQRKQDDSDSSYHNSNYALVDNLSGRQLFEDINSHLNKDEKNESYNSNENENEKNVVTSLVNRDSDHLITSHLTAFGSKPIHLSNFIAAQISFEHQVETSIHRYGFFTLNETFSSLLRPSSETAEKTSQGRTIQKKQKLLHVNQNSLSILSVAKHLFHKAELGPEEQENIDPLELVRSECRSFSSRSRFSARYIKRLVQEDESTTSSSDGNAINTSLSDGIVQGDHINTDDFDMQMFGDDMLMRLANWNQRWKKSMVETLEAASLKTKETLEMNSDTIHDKNNNLDIQLQNLMFGTEMTQLLHKKKSAALPPDEITEVLFELSNRIALTVPTSVNVNDSPEDYFSDDDIEMISSTHEVIRRDKEIKEAARFLLDDILPKWLQTFKPIQPSQRSVLWPLLLDNSLVKPQDDDLSVESTATGYSSPERGLKLEDQIAYLELDADTKSETCHLVTFYFIYKVIHDIKSKQGKLIQQKSSKQQIELTVNTALDFIETYGSYLKLYDAIIAATETYSTKIISSLLEVAKHDPVHINGMNCLFKNISSSMIYESKLLSCILHKVEVTPFNEDSFQNVLHLAVKAYPDLKPWLIRARLLVFKDHVSGSINRDNVHYLSSVENTIYYRYLSLLMKDYHMARMDPTLVREWCVLSTCNVTADSEVEIESRLSNFFKIVKNDTGSDDSSVPENQSSYAYHRDLHFLLDIAVHIEKYEYALKIEEEIISDPRSSRNLLIFTLGHLQNMAITVANKLHTSHAIPPSSMLEHILMLMNRIFSHRQNNVGNPFMDLPEELSRLLEVQSPNYPEKYILSLLASVALPTALLDAMKSWAENVWHEDHFKHLTDIVRKCLIRGLSPDMSAMYSDITPNVSLSFHRVESIQRRKELQISGSTNLLTNQYHRAPKLSRFAEVNIWTSLGNGDLTYMEK